MGKYTSKYHLWFISDRTEGGVEQIGKEADADIAQLQCIIAELQREKANKFNCKTLDELNEQYLKLEGDYNNLATKWQEIGGDEPLGYILESDLYRMRTTETSCKVRSIKTKCLDGGHYCVPVYCINGSGESNG